MDDSFLYILGIFAGLLGINAIERARRRRRVRPSTVFWSALAAYLFYAFDLRPSVDLLDAETIAAVGLAFCAISPILGWIWWGQHGRIRRRLLRAVAFLCLLIVSGIVWTALLGPTTEAVLLSFLTALLPFVPFRQSLRRWHQWRARRKRSRQERRELARSEREEQEERAELERLRHRERELEKQLAARDRQLSKRVKKEAKQQAKRGRLREETTGQIRQLRAREVERIRQGETGLRFHPHYGFLMAEAWRVLRAEIDRGERIPAVENDAFFFQVVEALVEPEDFEERYLHRPGRRAIAAVNAFLEGRQPLAESQVQVKKLGLEPTQLAPEPLPDGDPAASLVEAWLIPHRRFQTRQWEAFQDGRHPRQEQILQFLRTEGHELPDPTRWKKLWDSHPAIFDGAAGNGAAVSSTAPSDRPSRIPLWQRISSIWRDARAR